MLAGEVTGLALIALATVLARRRLLFTFVGVALCATYTLVQIIMCLVNLKTL